jgi:hypothetical protein
LHDTTPLILPRPFGRLARVDAEVARLLGQAVQSHKPKAVSWRLVDYQAVAAESQATAQAKAGVVCSTRLPLRAGFAVGERVWSERSRYLLIVRYDAAVVDALGLWQALAAFVLAHTVIFLSDTGGSSYWS